MNETLDRLPEMITRFKGYITESFHNNREIDSSTVSDYRFLAVAEYMMTKDASIFHRHILRASEILCELVNQGKHIEESSFVEVFIPLAIGQADMTKEFMSFLSDIKLNTRRRDFSAYLHLCFRKFILGIKIDSLGDDMVVYFEKKHRGHLGYAICFKALEEKKINEFEEGINVMMKNHLRLAHSSCMFSLEDQLIALWPLGMVNLARLSGMDVQINHPLIPQELIVPCQENQFIKQ